MSDIQALKLVTGEELVATVINTTAAGKCTVKNPLLLRVSSGPNGITVNFFPWTIIAEGEIDIESHAIVARYPVPKEVEDNYIQNTTGLQIVSGNQTSQILHG